MKHIAILLITACITTGAIAQCFKTEKEFETYFNYKKGELDPIEGIWLIAVDTSAINPDSVL